MAEGHRVRIGGDIKFFPKNDNQSAKAYARLAEDQWGRNEAGEFVQGETLWYDGVFEGREAEIINRDFQKGDALVVLGNAREYTNDKGYENTRLYVNSFGPDSARMTIIVDRVKATTRFAQQDQEQEATQSVGQDADAEAEIQAEAQVAQEAEASINRRLAQEQAEAAAAWQQAEENLRARVGSMIAANRLTEAQGNQIGQAWMSAQSTGVPAEGDKIVRAELEKMGLDPAEREYLGSVTGALAGTSALKSWEEAEASAQWAAVHEARATVRAPEPAPPAPAPSM